MKNIMEKIIKDKKMSLFFSLIFIFLLFIIVYVILNDNKQRDDHISQEEKQLIIKAGNFIASDLRSIDNSDVYIGNKNAKVKVIVYEDLSDEYSADFNKTLDLIINEFSNDISIAFRPYINKFNSNNNSINLLAYCANEQNKFFETRKLLLENIGLDFFNDEKFIDSFKGLNLNESSFNYCMNDNKSFQYLEIMKNEAENFSVYGTPTIFVNKEMVIGSRKFEDIINSEEEKIEGMKNIIIRNLNK